MSQLLATTHSNSGHSHSSRNRSPSPAPPPALPSVLSPAVTYLHGQAARTSGFYHSETGTLTYLAQYDKPGKGIGCHVFMRQGRDLVGRATPVEVNYRGKDYTKSLEKRKNPFSDEKVFKGLDGKNYNWEIERDHGDLILRDAKSNEVVLLYDAYNSATMPDKLTISSVVAEWKDLLVLVVLQQRFKFAHERAEAAQRAAEAADDKGAW